MSCAGIRDAIAKQNETSRIRAWVALFIGLLCCLGVLAVTIMLCFMMGFTSRWWLHIALGVFAIFMIVSLVALRAGVEPEVDAGPITAADLAIAQWTRAIGGVRVSPRHATAGFARIIMHGPALLIESASLFRSLVRADQPACEAAADLLRTLATTPYQTMAKVSAPDAAILLCRIGLAKITQPSKDQQPALTLTAKGRTLSETGSIGEA
ncbi:MAG: hypothetical protein NTV94_10055 [Planctomycetota bacterium]|nr:hypothetical protein [Planctomycetota bacterium]